MRGKKLIFIAVFTFFAFSLSSCKKTNSTYPRKAWVHSAKANLRTDPLLLASVIDILERNTPVRVLGRSIRPTQFGTETKHWYRVRLENGIEGWLYETVISDKPPELKKPKSGPAQTEQTK